MEYTGDYTKDFEVSNKMAGLNQKSTPTGYVWHHIDDYDASTNRGSMQLVEKQAHSGIPHKGGVSQYKTATGKSYTFGARNHSSKKIGGSAC
ncbi:HNH endonuclease signature motif containing protein [Pseudomonas syringae group genomosp. 7]|uniref:HNH endonuclease signature motif containing protein n=1 Tax=Pseudomonas syringae group genomosp. 7 TaxID=251699 RepID=UPI00217FEBDF|nr:HNH endonuclease [Pseudomonas syringae group genomosp. 7]